MTDGLFNLLGTTTIRKNFHGWAFLFTPKVLDDYAEKEAFILSRRHPNDTSGRYVTRIEEARFDGSLVGLAWSLWRALRDNHTEFGKLDGGDARYTVSGRGYSVTPDEGVQLGLKFIEWVGSERHSELLNIQSGIEDPPELGNSDGSGSPTPETPSDTDGPRGQDSSEPSLTRQDGPSRKSGG